MDMAFDWSCEFISDVENHWVDIKIYKFIEWQLNESDLSRFYSMWTRIEFVCALDLMVLGLIVDGWKYFMLFWGVTLIRKMIKDLN